MKNQNTIGECWLAPLRAANTAGKCLADRFPVPIQVTRHSKLQGCRMLCFRSDFLQQHRSTSLRINDSTSRDTAGDHGFIPTLEAAFLKGVRVLHLARETNKSPQFQAACKAVPRKASIDWSCFWGDFLAVHNTHVYAVRAELADDLAHRQRFNKPKKFCTVSN